MTATLGEALAPYLTEREMQDAIRTAALRNGWRFYHTADSRRSDAGFPDCVCVKGRRMLLFELKRQRGRVSPEQRRWIDVLATVGPPVSAFVVRPIPRDGELSYDDALAMLAGGG